jgi:hypothetical protein
MYYFHLLKNEKQKMNFFFFLYNNNNNMNYVTNLVEIIQILYFNIYI